MSNDEFDLLHLEIIVTESKNIKAIPEKENSNLILQR